MSWQRLWYPVCDACQAKGPPSHPSGIDAIVLQRWGWLCGQMFDKDLHLCPKCAQGELPDWWPDTTGTRFHWEEAEG